MTWGVPLTPIDKPRRVGDAIRPVIESRMTGEWLPNIQERATSRIGLESSVPVFWDGLAHMASTCQYPSYFGNLVKGRLRQGATDKDISGDQTGPDPPSSRQLCR